MADNIDETGTEKENMEMDEDNDMSSDNSSDGDSSEDNEDVEKDDQLKNKMQQLKQQVITFSRENTLHFYSFIPLFLQTLRSFNSVTVI